MEKSLKNNFYNLVPVQPLTEEQIKEIIKQSYGIVNDKWLRTIIDVSKGNLRFALMTSDVLISEDKTEKSICDILSSNYGIDESKVYVTYHPENLWGWNASMF